MPDEFTAQDFAPTNSASREFSEADFLPQKPKRTREQVIASIGPSSQSEVPALIKAGEWAHDNLGMALHGLSGGVSGGIRSTLQLPHEIGKAVGTIDPLEPNPIDKPLVSPELVSKAIEQFIPGGRPAEGSVGQGALRFTSELGSGLSSLPTMATLASGLVNPAIPANAFSVEMLNDIPHAMEALQNAPDAAGQTQAGLRTLFDVAAPLGLGRKTAKPVPAISDVRVPGRTGEQAQIKESQGPIPILGEQQATPLIKSIELDPAYGIEPAGKATKPPVEPTGGQISFLSPAEAKAVPNARQSANPSIGAGIKAALEKNQQAGAITLPTGKQVADLGKAAVQPIKDLIDVYAEPIMERVGRLGGPVGKRVSEEASQIVSDAKGFYGSIAPLVDEAKTESGKAFRGGTSWIRSIEKVTDKAATSRSHGAIEGTIPVPAKAQGMVNKLKQANMAIGQLAQQAAPGFVPSGKAQRMFTSYGLDVVKRGRGPAWEAMVEGTARANGIAVPRVERIFRKLKEEYDKPAIDSASLDKINQDFAREFPKAITHIKPGVAWHEVLVSDPFNYIEQAAQRTSMAAAFRKVYKPGSGLLDATRTAVQKELQTDRFGGEFDKLISSLQGHPVDSYTSWWNAPDSAVGGATRMLSQVVAPPLKALVLTGNALANLGETVTGGPSIFLGFRNVAEGMAKMKSLYPQLEQNGAVNRAMQNFAFDPTSPVRSTVRQFSNGVRRVFAEQVMNELQEAQAAAAAKVVADKIRAGTMDATEKQNVIAAMRAMGISEREANRGVMQGDANVLNQFERNAAARLTGGNQALAEKSSLGANRAFNDLFWFHSYPQMAWNQVRSVVSNLASDIENKNVPQIKANAKLLARSIGGRTMQGALYVGITALAFEGMTGLKERKQEARDDFGKFIVDSQIAAMGGPLYLMKRALESGGDTAALQQTAGSLVAPVGLGGELMDASLGNGRYEGAPVFDRIGTFVESKTPGWKAIKTGMALFGLNTEDRELQVAKRAFYRWRTAEKGWTKEIGTAGEQEDKEFRYQVRAALRKLEDGGNWRDAFPTNDVSRLGKSLFARTILKGPTGEPLTDEDLDKLRNRIGTKLVDKLQLRDAMVRQVARELGETESMQKVGKPTGEYAIDFETQAKRGEKTYKSLSEPLQAFLKNVGIDNVSYTPEISYGKEPNPPDPLHMDEAAVMQTNFVQTLERILPLLKDSLAFSKLSKPLQREQIQRTIQAARDAAKAKSRILEQQSRQQPQGQ